MEKSEKIVKALKDFFKKNSFEKAVLGLSGGVDSALTVKLAVMALGKNKVTALLMPNEGLSSDHSVLDAKAWAEELEIHYLIIPIQDFIQKYERLDWKASEEAQMNIQARVRSSILYHYANSHQALVLGTGNKTELSLGYFTKFGDGAVDLLPIGGLYKTEVWEMSKKLNLPDLIIKKTPSAELKENHTDESEIGMSYFEIDKILQKFESGRLAQTENEKRLASRIKVNQHKFQMPPIL